MADRALPASVEMNKLKATCGDMLRKYASQLKDFGDQGFQLNLRDDLLGEARQAMDSLSCVQTEAAACECAFAIIEDKLIQNQLVREAAEEFSMQYDRAVADIQSNPDLTRAIEALEQLQQGEDDMQTLDVQRSLCCPFTKKRFKHPVRSKLCQHTYERDYVYHLLEQQGFVQCPIQSCIKGKVKLKRKDLEDDVETQDLLLE
eukprot:m.358902 g.358902  ORF g.358902 m.358902 type:complete len:203 (+) comp18330_c0_seq1:239-847(+)